MTTSAPTGAFPAPSGAGRPLAETINSESGSAFPENLNWLETDSRPRALDLFCGGGGDDHHLEEEDDFDGMDDDDGDWPGGGVCGRWDNGRLSRSCSLAGTEEVRLRMPLPRPNSKGAGPMNSLPMTDAQIKHMVDRFLAWPLPNDFNPDGEGLSFTGFRASGLVGTNLFTAAQAEAMVRYMLAGLPFVETAISDPNGELRYQRLVDAFSVSEKRGERLLARAEKAEADLRSYEKTIKATEHGGHLKERYQIAVNENSYIGTFEEWMDTYGNRGQADR